MQLGNPPLKKIPYDLAKDQVGKTKKCTSILVVKNTRAALLSNINFDVSCKCLVSSGAFLFSFQIFTFFSPFPVMPALTHTHTLIAFLFV